MEAATLYSLLMIPASYLLGSVSGAYIVGRMRGIDMMTEPDGSISATAIYEKFGALPYLAVVAIDVGKGAAVILAAQRLDSPLIVLLVAGLAVVAGHDWSLFLRFKGGLGATVTGGVLAALVLRQFLMGMGVGAIVLLATRRTGLSTGIVAIGTSLVLLFQNAPLLLAVYPALLIGLMALKRYQVEKKSETLRSRGAP